MTNDLRRMDWLNANLDDLSVTRDLTAGVTFHLTFCASVSGCSVEVTGTNIWEVVDRAMEMDAERIRK